MSDEDLSFYEDNPAPNLDPQDPPEPGPNDDDPSDPPGDDDPKPDDPKPDDDAGYLDFNEIEDPKLRAKVESRIHTLTREKFERERKATSLERKLQELESKSEPPKEVKAPDAELAIDDPEAFAKQQQAYSEYLRQQYAHEQQEKQRTEQADQLRKEQFESRVEKYNSNIARLKVDQQQLAKAAETIQQAGLNDDVINYLLEDDEGPLLTAHLGSNIDDLIEVAGMQPYKAIAYMERVVRAKAGKKKTSSAPPPPTRVRNTRTSGAVEDGTTYE